MPASIDSEVYIIPWFIMCLSIPFPSPLNLPPKYAVFFNINLWCLWVESFPHPTTRRTLPPYRQVLHAGLLMTDRSVGLAAYRTLLKVIGQLPVPGKDPQLLRKKSPRAFPQALIIYRCNGCAIPMMHDWDWIEWGLLKCSQASF